MNFVKKILLVHGDAKARRTLALLIAGAGYDVRPFERSEAALEAAHAEWFDLALVADPLPEIGSFEFVEALKKLQPSVPVLLLVNQLELPSVIKGIRLAVTDVLAPDGDWASVVRRINAHLRPDATPAELDLTPEELAEVEAILAKVDRDAAGAAPVVGDAVDQTEALRDELQRLTRERDDFKKTAGRLAQEKTALEMELKAQLSRHAEVAPLETELAELRSEREVVAAAQTAVDNKARALAAAREELNRERAALAAERAQGLSADVASRVKSMEQLEHDRSLLEDLRFDLRAEDVRLREEDARVRHAQIRLETERRQLQGEMDLLREQEVNLRAYEQRLRDLTSEAEAQRVHSASSRRISSDPFQRDASLDAAWDKVNRAMDLLEAERRNFTDEKLVLREEKARLREREESMREWQIQVELRERLLNVPPPPKPSVTREPFKAARAIFASVQK
jgi:DNA-binding response OmpR family regulator